MSLSIPDLLSNIRKNRKILAAAGTFGLISLPTMATDPSSTEAWGTLLYSPAERQAIVQRRAGGLSEDIAPTHANVPDFFVSGLIKRDPGKGAAWINGQAIQEKESLHATGKPPVIAPGYITIRGQIVRVGERIDFTTGTRDDIVPPGSVSRLTKP